MMSIFLCCDSAGYRGVGIVFFIVVAHAADNIYFITIDYRSMRYLLCFFDKDERVQEAWEADVATEGVAIFWMQIVGWAWAQHDEWSVMELTRQGRLVARVPALMLLDMSAVHAYQQAAAANQPKFGTFRRPGISPPGPGQRMMGPSVAPPAAPGIKSTLSR
jgi:hypothetical protein